MGELIGELIPMGFAVAMSPMSLVGLIVVLTSARGVKAGSAYTIGGFLGILVPTGVALLAGDASGASDSSSAETGVQIGALLMALLLFYLSYRSFIGRPAPGQHAEEPKWLAGLNNMSLFALAGVGAALVALNVKNLPMMLSAASVIAVSDVDSTGKIVAVVVFALIGSSAALLATGAAMLGGDGAKQRLDNIREWLVQHNAVVMGCLFGVLGLGQFSKAISGLF